MKSMRELMPRKTVQIVKRYLDTFNETELADVAEYIEGKKTPDVVSEYPPELDYFAKEKDGKIEKDEDGFIYIVKGGKRIFKIDKDGDVRKPKGQKVLDNIFTELE